MLFWSLPPPTPHPPRRKPSAPCPGHARGASSRSLWPGGFRGERLAEKEPRSFLGGAGPAIAARDAGEGGRIPSRLNLPYRAGIIRKEHPCYIRASDRVCCALGSGVGVGGKDQQVPGGRGAGGWPHPSLRAARAPVHPSSPHPCRSRVCQRGGQRSPENSESGGDAGTTPPQEFPSPLESLSTSGERGHSPGAGASARETSPLGFCKGLSASCDRFPHNLTAPPTPA